MDKENNLKQYIQKVRRERKEQRFKGTFLDYVILLEKDPSIARLAHSRLYDIIAQNSTNLPPETATDKIKKRRVFFEESTKIYPFFEKDFFGMEKPISKIVRYFHSASLKGEESRQVLYLLGPVGAGKSSLMEKLKEGLEDSDQCINRE